MAKQHNKGRIPVIIILINLILVSIFLCARYDVIDKLKRHDITYNSTADTETEKLTASLDVQADNNLSDTDKTEYVTSVEDTIESRGYDAIATAQDYTWYLDTELLDDGVFDIVDGEIHILCNDDIVDTVDAALDQILGTDNITEATEYQMP